MKEGKIVPSAITVELLKKAILANTHVKCFLIDGFPRNLEQAGMFEDGVIDRGVIDLRYSLTLQTDCGVPILT